MELHWVWTSAATLLACYFLLHTIGRRLNGWYYDMKLGEKQRLLPPGDMGWPLIGNMLSFLRDFRSGTGQPDSFIQNLVSRYGGSGIYKTHLFLSPGIIICKPEVCRQVLSDDNNFKLNYPTTAITAVKTVLLDVSSEEHKRFGRLVTAPIMGYNALAIYLQRIEEIVTNSLEEMATKSMKQPVEVYKETKMLALRVILHIFMGSNHQKHIVKQVGDLSGDVLDALSSWPIYIPGFPYYKAVKQRKKLEKLVQSVVNERNMMIKNGQVMEKKDLVDVLLELQDVNGRKLKSEDIVDLLILFVMAGHATIASVMMWAMVYLTQNPQILKKAKEEQEEIMKSRPPSQKHLRIEEIKQMVYLSQVIDEVLRVSDFALPLFREATSDVNINGYIIPKGWRVLIWQTACHNAPEYFPNPKEFNPSRWDHNNAKSLAFIPFGAGTRFCPGRDLTKIEMHTFLHHFILNYKFEQINPECPVSYLPVSVPKDNCLAKVIKLFSA